MMVERISETIEQCQVFMIKHKIIPSTGYQWFIEKPDDVWLMDRESLDLHPDSKRAGTVMQDIFFLLIQNAGEYDIKFEKKRAWEKLGPLEEITYHVRVLENRNMVYTFKAGRVFQKMFPGKLAD